MKYRELGQTSQMLKEIALRCTSMFEMIICAIQGANRSAQVEENCHIDGFPLISGVFFQISDICEIFSREKVHHYGEFIT